MKAVRVHRFGGLDAMVVEDVPPPVPGPGEVLIRVRAAGVGPWDAWVRAGRSALPQPLPLTLGSDVSGVVEAAGAGFAPGDEVFGVTNAQFTGGYAELAACEAAMLARKPTGLTHAEAASVPVVATTAWQMVFDHGRVETGTRVLVHGAAGNVGAFAVQLAKRAGAHVTAAVRTRDVEAARALGADAAVDVQRAPFEQQVGDLDVVLDTIGGETLARSFAVLKPGGVLVSSAGEPDQEEAKRRSVRAVFFLVAVTTARLDEIGALLQSGALRTNVGEVLPLAEARLAHAMLAGTPHRPGKIVLVP